MPPPTEKVQVKPDGAYDYGSWRSIAAGTLVCTTCSTPLSTRRANQSTRVKSATIHHAAAISDPHGESCRPPTSLGVSSLSIALLSHH